MKKALLITGLLSSALLLGGCASSPASHSGYGNTPNINTANLANLENLEHSGSVTGTSVSKIRGQAIKETALTLGAQGGLAYRAKQINSMTTENTSSLDQVFNFQRLMLDNSVLPPVLVEADQTLNLASSTSIRLSGTEYKIIRQAEFVTTPPNWRQYLFLTYQKPSVPSATLLPKNSAERKLWVENINEGWQDGIEQANNIYQDNLARLQRDYKGMILYRKLLAQNIVSKPYVAKSNMGITSNKDHSKLYLNDRIMRITALPELNPNSKEWKPVAETNDGSSEETK